MNGHNDDAEFLGAVDREIHQRFRDARGEVWLGEALNTVISDLPTDESTSSNIPFDSAWELWCSTSEDIVTFGYREYTGDSLAMLDLGRGVTYVAVDTNEERGIDDYLIIAEVACNDWAEVRAVARSEMWSGAWSGEPLGMWPDEIIASSPLTPEDVHNTFSELLAAHRDVASGYAAWMEENGHGIWPIETRNNRAVLADVYVDIVLSYSTTEDEPDTSPEMAPGMLLDDLLAPENAESGTDIGSGDQQDLVGSPASTEDSAGSGAIMVTRVDVNFSDPNIRGASGSVFHAGTDQDRGDFLGWIEAGMTDHNATQKLAIRISRESQRVIEWFPRGSGNPSS
jgi:hypothetical protein